jgi:hypothetical protein
MKNIFITLCILLSFQSNVISQNPELNITAMVISDVTCNGNCDGIITIVATGGFLPYQYSINGGPFESINIFSGLCPGSYYCEIRDGEDSVRGLELMIVEPMPLSGSITIFPSGNENSGIIKIAASGGIPPYSYELLGVDISSQNIFSDLVKGNYEIGITDSNGCVFITLITIDEINKDNSLSINGDVLTVNMDADTYQWINSETQTIIEGETSKSFKPEQSGKYRVEMTLTNPNGLVGKNSKSNQTISLSSATYDFNKSLGVSNNRQETIKLFPNPAGNYLKLSKSIDKEYVIYSTLGKKLQSGEIINQSIPIDRLVKGIYYLQIDRNTSFKFVKN